MCLSPYFFASCQYIIPVLRVHKEDVGTKKGIVRSVANDALLMYLWQWLCVVWSHAVSAMSECLDALLDVPHEGTETEEWVVNIELVKFIEETVNLLVFDDGDDGTVH